MSFADFVLSTYGRLIRTPVIGPMVAIPVRIAKRLVDDPARRFQTKLDLAIASSASMRNDLESATRRLEEMEREVQRLRFVLKQQTAVLETVGADQVVMRVAPEKLVVRLDWPDGGGHEIVVPMDGRHDGVRISGAKTSGGDVKAARPNGACA